MAKSAYKTYYAAAKINPVDVLRQRFPEQEPTDISYFESYKQAEGYLAGTPVRDFAMSEVGYGPMESQHINLPRVDAIYAVEPTGPEALMMDDFKTYVPFVGTQMRAPLMTKYINDTEYRIGPDALHDGKTVSEHVPEGSLPENSEVYREVMSRAYDLQRLQNGIERANDRKVLQLDFEDPETRRALRDAYCADGFTHRQLEDADLATRAFQEFSRRITDDMSITEAMKLPDLHATFNARLEAQPDTLSPAEAVRQALSETIDIAKAGTNDIVDNFKYSAVKDEVDEIVAHAEQEAQFADREGDELDDIDAGDSVGDIAE